MRAVCHLKMIEGENRVRRGGKDRKKTKERRKNEELGIKEGKRKEKKGIVACK